VVLVVASMVALAGCDQDGDAPGKDEPAGAGTATSELSEQARGARAMVECLQAAGVPALEQPENDSQGQVGLGFDTDEPYSVRIESYEYTYWAQAESQEDLDYAYEYLAEMKAQYDPSMSWEVSLDGETVLVDGEWIPMKEATDIWETALEVPYLIIDQTDYTAELTKCLDETGYTEPVYEQDPADELAEKQINFKSTVKWVECARQNGYPDLASPSAPIADGYATYPVAVLPGDISEQELRDLLALCPNFNEDTYVAAIDAIEALGESPSEEDLAAFIAEHGAGFPPVISFDIPGAAAYAFGDTSVPEPSAADEARLEILFTIVFEAEDTFNDSLAGLA
jgi:hypothetical protein